MANILNAKNIAEEIKLKLLEERKRFSELTLASVVFKNDDATQSYCLSQKKWAEALDIRYENILIEEKAPFDEPIRIIKELNKKNIQGIILNKPFPSGWDEMAFFSSIDVSKDIEGLNPYNLGRVFFGEAVFIPPTVLSVLELLKLSECKLYGKNVVIVGFSNILGKPLSVILADRLATVSITHIGTFEANNLLFYVSNADILITAVGKPHLIKGSWIKEGAVVIDVGMGKLRGKLTGDVEFEEAKKKASFITPVPGGVGALTVAFLFSNLLKAAGIQKDS